MAKIQANTISGAGMSNVRAPYTPPDMATGNLAAGAGRLAAAAGHAGSVIAAGVRPYDAMNANIERRTRQKVANGDARTREMQGALKGFSGGVTSLLGEIGKVMERRADEQAEAEISNYTRHLMAGEAEDYATPVTGDLTPDLSDERQKDAVDGPYRAVARRIADYNETGGYKALSSRARERFEEMRRKVDDHFLGRALTRDIAAREQLRDAQRVEEARTKTDLATHQALDAGDPDPGKLVDLAEDAIDFSAKEMARRMRIVTPDGEVVPGSEAVYDGVRRKAADAVYMDIWQKMAQTYAASDDEVERNALRRKMLSMVSAKSGHDVRELLGEDERKRYDEAVKAAKESGAPDVERAMSDALKASASGMPFSDDAARAGWDLWKKAERQLDTRLRMERAKLNDDAESLEYAIFSGTVGGDPFEAAEKLSEMEARLPQQDRDRIRAKVDGWKYARATSAYEKRIWDAWKLEGADAQKQAFEAIEAEAKGMSDPKIGKAVMSMLSGAMPSKGKVSSSERIGATEAEARLVSMGLSGKDALDTLTRWREQGLVTPDTYFSAWEKVKNGEIEKINPTEVFQAAESAGIPLKSIFVTQNDRPVLDEKGALQVTDPNGTTQIEVLKTQEWRSDRTLAGGHPELRRKYVDVANSTLLSLYRAAARYATLERIDGKNRQSLADFLKTECAGDIRQLDDMRLRVAIERANDVMESDFATLKLRGAGRSLMVFQGESNGMEER